MPKELLSLDSFPCVQPSRHSRASAALIHVVPATAHAGDRLCVCPCHVVLSGTQNGRRVHEDFHLKLKRDPEDQAVCDRDRIHTGSSREGNISEAVRVKPKLQGRTQKGRDARNVESGASPGEKPRGLQPGRHRQESAQHVTAFIMLLR